MKVVNPVYRRDDRVRVIIPRVFERCGYPMSIQDAREEISKMREGDKLIYDLIQSFGIDIRYGNVYGKIVNALAYGLLHTRGFGGPERTIHTVERPEIKGQIYRVTDKFVVKTGIYRRGSSDPEDPEGPSLRNVKTHTILRVESIDAGFNYDYFSIEATNVERVTEDKSMIW